MHVHDIICHLEERAWTQLQTLLPNMLMLYPCRISCKCLSSHIFKCHLYDSCSTSIHNVLTRGEIATWISVIVNSAHRQNKRKPGRLNSYKTWLFYKGFMKIAFPALGSSGDNSVLRFQFQSTTSVRSWSSRKTAICTYSHIICRPYLTLTTHRKHYFCLFVHL